MLTVSLATLAAAGLPAEGRVGDGDIVQATEDTLRTYAATAVVVVAPRGAAERQIRELDRRLEGQVHRVAVAGTTGTETARRPRGPPNYPI